MLLIVEKIQIYSEHECFFFIFRLIDSEIKIVHKINEQIYLIEKYLKCYHSLFIKLDNELILFFIDTGISFVTKFPRCLFTKNDENNIIQLILIH